MTVIAGYTDGKVSAIAGDSGAFEEGGLYQLVGEPKVWRSGDALIGSAGSFRVMEVARKSGLSDPYALRNHLQESNVSQGWTVLVVTKKFLFEIDDEFGVLRLKENYCAIGAGNSVAMGALAVLSQMKSPSVEAVKTAVKTTIKHSNLAMSPITVLQI